MTSLQMIEAQLVRPNKTRQIQHIDACQALTFVSTGNVLEHGTSARVSIQFLVKDKTIFQHIAVTNTGFSPIENFSLRADCHMLIRDLDYLEDLSYNSDSSKSYIRGRGPNGFGWITALVIDSEDSGTTRENDTAGTHVAINPDNGEEGQQPLELRAEITGSETSTSSSKIQAVEGIRPLTNPENNNVEHEMPPENDQDASAQNQASIARHQISTEESETDDQLQEPTHNTSKQPPGDDEVWQQRQISDTWTFKDAHAVVSVMNLFVDGNAQKMELGRHHSRWAIGASGSESNVLRITAAYKMIAVPKERVHWKNFLIPAENADVSAMIAEETKELWGDTGDCNSNYSLRDIGICMKGGGEQDMEPDTGGPGQKLNPSGPESYDAMKSDNTATRIDSHMNVETGGDLATAQPSNRDRSSPDTSAKYDTGITLETSQKVSAIDSIEYITWRHAEHILSACTVPLSTPLVSEEESSGPNITQGSADVDNDIKSFGTSKRAEAEHDVPIALTCGDMSGHRVCTSASFFAFQFLVDLLQRLDCVKETSYIISLQRRIKAVCRGHVRWLEWIRKPWLPLDRTESLLDSGCFAANYWVNGQRMKEQTMTWQPDDAITDTPFQILKVTTYIKWLRTAHSIHSLQDERLRPHMALLRDVWAYLILELDDLDKRKACAWCHESEDGLNTYRLDAHVWLWNSLADMQALELWSLTEANAKSWEDSRGRWISKIFPSLPGAKQDEGIPTDDSGKARDPGSLANFVSKAKRLSPKEVQRAVLQRFTVENDVSGERMLAVTRSARDTRFFFHARDTVLFYGHKRGFFRPETSLSELWKRTIKCQSHHEEALQDGWQSPLRFALGAVAGLNGFSVDKRSPAELVRQSVEALIRTSSHNGFIPGEMDAVTREPTIFQMERDRDYYYHVGFEACGVLFKYGRDIDKVFRSEHIDTHSPVAKQNEDHSRQLQRENDMMRMFVNEMLAQPKKQNLTNYPQGSDYRAFQMLFGGDTRLDRKRISMAMKKSMPFNNMIDASSIAPLEEEWLYNYPDFLLVKDMDLQVQLEKLFDTESQQYKAVYGSQTSIIDKALEVLGKTAPKDFSMKKTGTDEWSQDGMVVSLPKQKGRREKRRKWSIGAFLDPLFDPFNKSLWDSTSKERSAVTAKKRFLWLPASSNPETALLCWLASTDAEKSAISLFFDRHAGYDNHLWDDTTMVINTWQTELHLCFWLIYDKSRPLDKGLPYPLVAPWPRGNDKEFRRASIGFRFNGDFFDRYWTCHFIQYVPGFDSDSTWGVPWDWIRRFTREKESWQRKVLELQLLQHVLNLMLTSSNKILEEIEAELGIKKGILINSVLTTEAYSASENHWQIYEQLLGKAEEDIISSLNTLSKWATREDDRGQERPRWTRNDERKYRSAINKLRSQTERQRWDLESSRDKMRKLRETLATRQAKIRSDVEAKRDQNTAYFTYVTVIFLPLGFAASFYSMNGAPPNDLIVSLAKFSAAAFAVTAFLLFSASAISFVVTIVLSPPHQALLEGTVRLVSFFKKYGGAPAKVFFLDVKSSVMDRLNVLWRLPGHIKEKSLLVGNNLVKREPGDTKALPEIYSRQDWTRSWWFWPTYILVELPTRTISSGWTALVSDNCSPGAVLSVALCIVALPFYALSTTMLSLYANIVFLLKISRLLFRFSKHRFAKEDHKPRKRLRRERVAKAKVQRPQPSIKESPEGGNDVERSEPGNNVTPADRVRELFQKLLPSAKPFESLQWIKKGLNEKIEKSRERNREKAEKE